MNKEIVDRTAYENAFTEPVNEEITNDKHWELIFGRYPSNCYPTMIHRLSANKYDKHGEGWFKGFIDTVIAFVGTGSWNVKYIKSKPTCRMMENDSYANQ